MDEPIPQGIGENPETNLRIFYWTHIHKEGITYQDMDNPDAWLAMKGGLDLRKWA